MVWVGEDGWWYGWVRMVGGMDDRVGGWLVVEWMGAYSGVYTFFLLIG